MDRIPMPTTSTDPASIVETFDLSPVRRRLERKGVPHADRLEAEFRRVAALWLAHPGRNIAPSKIVDEFWHEFILDSRRYREFCTSVYGAYLDHVPDDTFSGMWDVYEDTLALYRQHFGEPDPVTWGPVGANSMGNAPVPAPAP